MSRTAGRRHRSRELALRVLFEVEGTDKDAEFVIRYQGHDIGATADVIRFARRLVYGCLEQSGAIDTAISAASLNWNLVDLGKVERAVLRLGTYELLFERRTPAAVTMDESVEIAKAYAGEDAGHFVNGVLGQVLRAREGSPSASER